MWCLDPGALQRLERCRLPRTMRAMSEHPANLGESDALRGDRHHDAGEAGLGLAQLERVDPVALGPELLGQLVETKGLADRGRIAAELGSERWVHDQPLDQLSELVVLLVSG
jgi:hypothetical protein